MFNNSTLVVGLDLGDRHSLVAIVNHEGALMEHQSRLSSPTSRLADGPHQGVDSGQQVGSSGTRSARWQRPPGANAKGRRAHSPRPLRARIAKHPRAMEVRRKGVVAENAQRPVAATTIDNLALLMEGSWKQDGLSYLGGGSPACLPEKPRGETDGAWCGWQALVLATSGTAAGAIWAVPVASAASLLARPCDVHCKGPVTKLFPIEHADGFLRFRLSGHFDESEAL